MKNHNPYPHMLLHRFAFNIQILYTLIEFIYIVLFINHKEHIMKGLFYESSIICCSHRHRDYTRTEYYL